VKYFSKRTNKIAQVASTEQNLKCLFDWSVCK